MAFSLYDNLQNIKNGKEITTELETLIPQGQELVVSLKAIKPLDLMPILEEYLKAKEEGIEAAKMFLFFDVKNQPVEDLIVRLETLAKKLNKDLIKDIWERNGLEKKFTQMTEFMENVHPSPEGPDFPPFRMEQAYLYLSDAWGELLDEDNINYLRGKPLKNKEITESMIAKRLQNLKSKIGNIINWELESLSQNQFEYGFLTVEQKLAQKKRLESILNMSVEQMLEIKNMSEIGQTIENRINCYDQIRRDYEALNQKIGEYFPFQF